MIRSPKFTSGLLAAVLAVCGMTASLSAVAADKVTVQLKWLPQAQFAGYYVAQSKGYYKDAGLDVTINGVQVCRGCAPGEPRERVDLSGRDVRIVVDLHAGEQAATVWTSDLTAAYVHENSAYST